MAKLEIQLGADSAELLKGLADSEREIRSWVSRINKVTPKVNVKAFEKELLDLKNQLAAQRVATEQARTSTNEFKTSQAEAAAEAARYRAQQAAAAAELAKLRLANQQAKQQVDAASGSYREAQQRLTALGQSIRNAKDGFTATTPEIRAQIAEYRKLNDQLKAFDKQMGNHQREVGNYGLALAGLNPIFRSLDASLGLVGSSLTSLVSGDAKLRDLGGAFKQLAVGAAAFIATPLGATLLALGTMFALFQANKDTVIQFDAGLKNVAKTTGLAGKELQNLSQEIIFNSRQLQVIGTDKLLEYATVAGQLGVKGSKDINNFSTSLSQLEIASNLKGEEGATQVARFLTLVDGGVQNVKTFGDELVNLGNNFAATEKEIIVNAEAISQNVGLYKIGRQDVLAYATATKALGLEAEVVGSTFNRTLAIFEAAIRTGDGLDKILKVVGGTSAQLSKRFKEDASGVFQDYIKGLNGIFKSGNSVNEALEKTGVIAVRDQRVIATLASSGYDTLSRAMDDVRTASGALGNEFDAASTKLENGAKRVGIAWDNLVLTIENGDGVIAKSTNSILGFIAGRIESLTTLVNGVNAIALKLKNALLDAAVENYQRTGKTNSLVIGVNEVKAELDKREKVRMAAAARTQANILAEGKSELQLRKQLEAERVKLYNNQKAVNQQVSPITGLYNFGGQANANKQIEELKKQKALVEELDKIYKDRAKSTVTTGGGSSIFSNGGEADEKAAKRIAETYKNLSAELKSNPLDFGATAVEIAEKNINSYQKAIDNLVKNGIKPASDAIKKLQAEQEKIAKSFVTPNLAAASGLTTGNSRGGFAIPSTIALPNFQVKASPSAQQDNTYITRAIRSSINSVINDTVSGFASIGQRNYDIEKKYSDMRIGATNEQIRLFTELERLEKQTTTSLFATLNNAFQSLTKGVNDVFIKGFSDKLANSFNSADFNVGGLSNKVSQALVGGAALAGQLISGVSKPTSKAGQGIGGALSGAATGAALGSVIPGLGTAVGAIGGALVGALGGILGASKAKKQEKLQEEQVRLQKAQLAEQQRANALAYSSSIIGQMTNQGIVTGVDRDAYGNIVGKIEGKDLVLIIDRTRNSR